MKILITEKQAERLFEENIDCKKCEHSWSKKKNDKYPYLCHMCGWDNKTNKYNDEELFNFWKKETKKK